jgi:hypothetical protein
LEELDRGLLRFSIRDTTLAGVGSDIARRTLAQQMIASLRRLDYTEIQKNRDIHPDRANPDSHLFDPERAALWHARNGNPDEAIWLIFLSIHFGKNRTHGWRMLRDVYSGLGAVRWTWARVSVQLEAFRDWLRTNRARVRGAFGNHRKYETLVTDSNSSTALVIESFVDLCRPSPLRRARAWRDLTESGIPKSGVM